MHRRTLTFREPLAAVARPTPISPPPEPPAPLPIPVHVPVPDPALTAHLLSLVAGLSSVVDQLRSQHAHAIGEAAQASVELGIAVAERLLGVHIAADQQRLDQIVRASLERMPSARAVTVRAHPDDIALLEKQMEDGAEKDVLTLRPDAMLARGGLKLEADEWLVTWDTQRSLAELRAALLEETLAGE